MLTTFRRRLVTGAVTAGLALGVLGGAAGAKPNVPACVSSPYTGQCYSPTVTGIAEAPDGLNIRSGPGTGYGVVGVMPNQSSGTVYCYRQNDSSSVNGDPYWDFISTSYGTGYVSDYWLLTYGNIYQQVDQCVSGLS